MDSWAHLLENHGFPALVATLLLIAGIRQYKTLGRRVSALEKANAELLTRYASEAHALADRANHALEKVADAFRAFTQTLAQTHGQRFNVQNLPGEFFPLPEDDRG